MPLTKRWSVLNRDNIQNESDTYGCYEFGDIAGNILYIGQGRVRQRLLSRWNTGEKLGFFHVSYYRCEYCGSKERAVQMERVEMKRYMALYRELPYYNKIGWHDP